MRQLWQQRFKGTGVALVTPFDEDGSIDFVAHQRIIEHCIGGGVTFLVALGTTGESTSLSYSESTQLLDATKKIVAQRVPLVVGFFGGNNTADLVEKIKKFDFDGFDALMSSSPAYNKPTQEGIFQHYMKLAEASPVPLIIYNVPSRTASNIEPETVLRLAYASEKFVAVKEASGNLTQAMKIIKDKPADFLVICGDDTLTLPMIAAGADGVISVVANAFPKEFSDLTRAALADNYPEARRLNELLLDLHPWLYVEGNPAGIKAALAVQNICGQTLRLPLVPVGAATFQQILEITQQIQR